MPEAWGHDIPLNGDGRYEAAYRDMIREGAEVVISAFDYGNEIVLSSTEFRDVAYNLALFARNETSE